MDAHILDLDKPRKLKFGFGALKELKKKYGKEKSMADIMRAGLDEVPFWAWVGLLWEDKELTAERVEELIDEAIPEKYTLLGVSTLVADAILDQMGMQVKKKAKVKTGKKKKAPSLSTVKSRTRSGSTQKKNSTA